MEASPQQDCARKAMASQKKQVTADDKECSQGLAASPEEFPPTPAVSIDGGTNGTSDQTRVVTRLLLGLVALAVLYTLVLAQSFFVPLFLAFLLSLVLAPIVRWLEWLHMPRTLGAGIIVLLLLSGLSYGVASSLEPVSNWVEQAPRLLRQLEHKIYPIKKTVEEVSKTADQVDRIASVSTEESVEVKGISFRDMLYTNARGLVTGTVMTTFLLYFFLSWGQVMLMRVMQLHNENRQRQRHLELATFLESEISKYLLTITLINVGLGAVVASALYAFDIPNPLLWGVIAALLNYIPYLGGLVTAVLLGATALLTFDGLAVPALVVATFAGLTIFEGQIVTPLLLGRRLALNPLVVSLSVIFWFWLWGVMGALMAVPILITIKLISDRVESMRPIGHIVGR
jgi:predicted PurR-regulated permease PerM